MSDYKFKTFTFDGEMLGPFDLSGDSTTWMDEMQSGEILLCTNFKDIRSNEIYEGDIVLRHRNCEPAIEEVQLESKNSWILKGNDGRKALDLYWEHVEVIGNVYEHPHLLEEERT
ncbi:MULTISPECIES: YopX family protein [unclassified Exiguobacterium]|uniref:YopX family protein n=1 Tax=unclassified Exiguobacterium TaxID=2644629 RepID=UPI0025B89573|nr:MULTISPECIES: YopX family protein [unclassified Exiguobacterium]